MSSYLLKLWQQQQQQQQHSSSSGFVPVLPLPVVPTTTG